MSFRNRLTLFFVLIVVVPMVAVAFVLFRLIADNESGKADARLAAANSSAINLYHEDYNRAQRAAAKIGGDVALAQALRANDRQALQTRLSALLTQENVRRIVLARGGRAIADAGSRTAVFPAARTLVGSNQAFGTLQVSVQEPSTYTGLLSRLTGSGAVVQRVGGPVLASSVKGVDPASIPSDHGELEVGDKRYDAASFKAAGFLG